MSKILEALAESLDAKTLDSYEKTLAKRAKKILDPRQKEVKVAETLAKIDVASDERIMQAQGAAYARALLQRLAIRTAVLPQKPKKVKETEGTEDTFEGTEDTSEDTTDIQ